MGPGGLPARALAGFSPAWAMARLSRISGCRRTERSAPISGPITRKRVPGRSRGQSPPHLAFRIFVPNRMRAATSSCTTLRRSRVHCGESRFFRQMMRAGTGFSNFPRTMVIRGPRYIESVRHHSAPPRLTRARNLLQPGQQLLPDNWVDRLLKFGVSPCYRGHNLSFDTPALGGQ